ncbi:MAG: hypothetical protein GY858_09865 [Candidatus Omnitrophica bacterium]|nr:hypothetical protein [Candidatus Omnitrophota bacterium]
MLALLGGVAGFFSSLVPELLAYRRDHSDKKHELEVMRLQIEVAKHNNTSKLEEIRLVAESEEAKSLYGQAKPVSVAWADALLVTVRPIVTYTLFLMYIIMKLIVFYKYFTGASPLLWTSEDEGLLCGVIGFWFGVRSMNRLKHTNGN